MLGKTLDGSQVNGSRKSSEPKSEKCEREQEWQRKNKLRPARFMTKAGRSDFLACEIAVMMLETSADAVGGNWASQADSLGFVHKGVKL